MLISDMPEIKKGPPVLIMPHDSTVREAAAAMAAAGMDAVVVMRDSHLEGIFTERDLLNRVVAAEGDPGRIPLADVMTRDVVTAGTGDQVAEALGRIEKAPFSHMPVLDKEGHIAGMLRQEDFTAFTLQTAWHRTLSAAKAAVTAWYQPFLIALSFAIYTVTVIALSAYWLGQG